MTKRGAALAGMWYPGSEEGCRQKIETMMGPTPKRGAAAGVVPHAGWEYSGPVAIQVFQALAVADPIPEQLILFGTHMHSTSPAHISRASSFETPLGPLASDDELTSELAKELELRDDPADGRWGGDSDNTVEVQLPLIKHLLPDVRLVVIGPPASVEAIEIGAVATRAALARGVPTAVVGSTDLTHYGGRFGFAPKGHGAKAVEWVKDVNDAKLIERVLAFDPEGVLTEAAENRNACVPGAVAAVLAGAKELGLEQARLLEYKTSYDVQAGDTFVGYAAIAFD
jgi:MEMO1 family protein